MLEWTLLLSFVAHGAGMLSMVAFLLPGMPGGGVTEDAARVAYVAAHPWLWRLGWLPWQVTALSDLLIAVALIRTRWVPRAPAVVAFALTAAAVVPDQLAQAIWVTTGVEVARAAIARGDVAPYLELEARIFPLRRRGRPSSTLCRRSRGRSRWRAPGPGRARSGGSRS